MKKARHIIDRFTRMQTEKSNWLPLYQLCAEYVMARKQGFTTSILPGEIQTEQIFDDTAPEANTLMASALIGAMWPNGAKSFRISMPFGMEEEEGDTEELKLYYQAVTKRMAYYMDKPSSGFATALKEYMLDQGAFGISGIQVEDQEDDFDTPLMYRALDAKALFIDEGPNGFVNTVYISKMYTIRQLVAEYGIENVSKANREIFMSGKGADEKVEVIQAIEPRMDADPFKLGVQNMPYASIHVEKKSEKILKESGLMELPAAISRFWRAMGEKYGRCPAMQALPSILEANALGEAWILAVEKTLDPSLLVMDDGTLGGGKIDTSPGGITVVSVSGRIGANTVPIQPLFLVGDLQWTAERRVQLKEGIRNHFFVDRLMDLNNEARMTLGEANIRNGLRGQTLNTTFVRQFAELFAPIIEITFNKLRRRGLLGVIPGSPEEAELIERGIIPLYIPEAVIRRMVSGQEVYHIEFISEAARIMQAEELQGIEHLLLSATTVAPVEPTVLDVIDWDWALQRIQELDGAPRECIRSAERIAQLRRQRQQQLAAERQIEDMRQNSETARNVGQALSSVKDEAA